MDLIVFLKSLFPGLEDREDEAGSCSSLQDRAVLLWRLLHRAVQLPRERWARQGNTDRLLLDCKFKRKPVALFGSKY